MKVAECKIAYRPSIDVDGRKPLTESARVVDFARKVFDEDQIGYREFFYILMLNRAGKPLGFAKISEGGTASTYVDIKMVMQYLILANASGVILIHNHPSGVMKPSAEDDKLTRKINEACSLFDIKVCDHIILSGLSDAYYSYADNGRI